MSFVASVVSPVVDFVGDVVEGAVDFVGNAVESVVNVISDPFDDPLATIMTAAAVYTGYNAWTAAPAAAAPGSYAAVSGPMFNTAIPATTGIGVSSAGVLTPGLTSAVSQSALANAAGSTFAFTGGMTGSALSLAEAGALGVSPGAGFVGVGAESAAGSMTGSVWGATAPTFMQQATKAVVDPINEIITDPDPVGKVWEKVVDKGAQTFVEENLGMADNELGSLGQFGQWSPTIGYQSGGDPASGSAQSYPSFTRAETGILGDPFNLEGRDLGLTVSNLSNMLQQQQTPAFPLPQMPGAFRGGGIGAEQQRALLDPNYNASQVQQPMLEALTAQLGAGAQRRGLETTPSGLAAGIAPLMEQFQRNRLADLQAGAGLDLQARGQGIQGRGQDIQALLGQQDVSTAADVARKNITLNSLLALAQMSKPQIVGGTTSFEEKRGGTAPSVGFSGAVPVGGIAQAGWDKLIKPAAEGVFGWLGDLF